MQYAWCVRTSIEAVFSGSKSPPICKRGQLHISAPTGTTHVNSHDCTGAPHGAPPSVRMWFPVLVPCEPYAEYYTGRQYLVTAGPLSTHAARTHASAATAGIHAWTMENRHACNVFPFFFGGPVLAVFGVVVFDVQRWRPSRVGQWPRSVPRNPKVLPR